MWSLAVVIVVLQMLFRTCQSTDSALSCALGFYDNYFFIDGEQQLVDEFFNKTDDESIESNVAFRLYTPGHLTGSSIMFLDENSLKNSDFKADRPTRIITHGFNGRGTDTACMGPTNAFLKNGAFNVIVIDWFSYQITRDALPIYGKVVRKVKKVGLHLAKMINFLEEHGMNPNTTTLIGHSLGAHVMGIAGYYAKTKVNHVIGLDPAKPMFKYKKPGKRISNEDAVHVEIIHTNGGHCGMSDALGHYDFYVNGGSDQPGCSKNSCSHSRAYNYYTESINRSNGFYGRLCIDSEVVEKEKCSGEIALMGGISRDAILPGVYFIETNDKSPYAKGYPKLQRYS